jgi:predicted nuclease of restriction endonuclease-like (RecB) superfamily
MSELEKTIPNTSNLVLELSSLIDQSKQQVAKVANSTLTILFWNVGKRIQEEVLKNERAEYGKQIITIVSVQLEVKYGRNFTEKNVRRMIRFFQEFSDFNILPPLAAKLSWSHFIELFPLKSKEAKLFYAQHCIEQNWGKRELRNQIQRKAFERTELANLQFSTTQPDLLNTFKDPYVLDFLHLKKYFFRTRFRKNHSARAGNFCVGIREGVCLYGTSKAHDNRWG